MPPCTPRRWRRPDRPPRTCLAASSVPMHIAYARPVGSARLPKPFLAVARSDRTSSTARAWRAPRDRRARSAISAPCASRCRSRSDRRTVSYTPLPTALQPRELLPALTLATTKAHSGPPASDRQRPPGQECVESPRSCLVRCMPCEIHLGFDRNAPSFVPLRSTAGHIKLLASTSLKTAR